MSSLTLRVTRLRAVAALPGGAQSGLALGVVEQLLEPRGKHRWQAATPRIVHQFHVDHVAQMHTVLVQPSGMANDPSVRPVAVLYQPGVRFRVLRLRSPRGRKAVSLLSHERHGSGEPCYKAPFEK